MKPQFYYQWGNEPKGKVSTGAYDKKDVYHFTGYYSKDEIKKLNLKFHNPHA